MHFGGHRKAEKRPGKASNLTKAVRFNSLESIRILAFSF